MGIFKKLFNDNKKRNNEIQSQSNVAISTSNTISKVDVTGHIPESQKPDIPELQGDYAKAVFLAAYGKASSIRNNSDYQRYLLYECGIRNASEYHKELIKQGYLQEASWKEILKSQKMPALKEMLRELGQPVSGKKDNLIQRIVDNADEDIVRGHYPERLYDISEKGQEFLSNTEDYIRLHRHKNWGVGWQEYDRKKQPGYGFYDTMWRIFNERVLHDQNFGRNEYYYMYQLLVEENKRKEALQMLLRVLYIDLSGSEGLSLFQSYTAGFYTIEELRERFDTAVMLAPGIVGCLAEYKDVYNESYIERLYEWKLPLQICSKKTFTSIVQACMDGMYNEEVISKELKQQYIKVVSEFVQSKNNQSRR